MSAVLDESVAHYRTAFEAVHAAHAGSAAQRAAAFERFAALGFPGPRDEAWKYTSLRRLASRRFQAPAGTAPAPALPRPLAEHRLVILDGRRAPALSTPGAPPAGLCLRSLAEAHADGGALGALLRVAEGGGTERFTALNAALCPDVVLLDVADGAAPAVLEVLLASWSAEPGISHPRLVVRAGRGSTARVLLRHVGDDAERLVNSVVDVEVGPNATLHLYRLLDSGRKAFHIDRIDATVGQRGTFVAHDAQLGAGLSRLDLNARLVAPLAAAELTGLFLADGAQHLGTHVRVDHLAVGTRSLQDYRGIAAG